MKEVINSYFSWVSKFGVIIVVLATLFLFTNYTTDFYDAPKFIVLTIVTALLLILITARYTVENKVSLIRTPLDIPLLLILAVGAVATFASPSSFINLLGNQVRVYPSFVALVVLVIFYFCLVNSLKGKNSINLLFFVTKIAAGVLGVISILAYAGMKLLPSPWSHGINFTTTGSTFSTTAVMVLLIPLLIQGVLKSRNSLHTYLNAGLLALFGVVIALTGNWQTQAAGVLALVVSLVFNGINSHKALLALKPSNLIALALPLAVTLLIVVLSLVPPMGKAQNPLYTQAQNFKNLQELQAPFIPSWKVAVSSFRDNPFWGSGPASYLFDFTNYKPIEINSSNLWNIRFDSSFNEYFQALATLGGVGLVALLSLTALFISSAYPSLVRRSTFDTESVEGNSKAFAIAGLMFFVLLALHPSTLVLWVIGLIIIASFYTSQLSNISSHSWGMNNGMSSIMRIAGNIASGSSSEETIRIEALPSILLTIAIGLALVTGYFGGKFVLADYHHRLALTAAAQNQAIPAYNELITAEKLNPQNDTYHTDLAQINFALANAIAQAKAPTQASPSGSLTDQDKQNIQVLLQQAINEGRTATTLAPRSALNWEVLALLYRQIAGVAQNALAFSLDAYGRAIFQDPLNPNLRLSVGGVYYAVQSYDQAIRFFTDAINLKPDFANGYFNLSVALRDKGDLPNAQAAAEKLLTLVDKNSQDYQVAQAYLTDLKNRIASGSAQQSKITPPASQTQGDLQNNQLPKVVNVGEPDKIATPPAVKKPNTTPEPTSTP